MGCAPVLAGLRGALTADPNLHILLFGDAETLDQVRGSRRLAPFIGVRLTLLVCGPSVTMQDKPLQVLRSKTDSSMAQAIAAVAEERCAAMVSGGNTAALVALGVQLLGTIEGVARPAICTAMPARIGRTWFLDMGANLEPTLEHMLANARMGASHCRIQDGIEAPRVAIMNVGSESTKGTRHEQELAELLQREPGIEFVGFAEGADLFSGELNLIVCDGFTGNVALKTAEGMARYLRAEFQTLLGNHWIVRMCYALLRRNLRSFRKHMDPANYNGAALLGLGGLVVKSHGAANGKGFQRAIEVTAQMARRDAIALLRREIALSSAAANST